MPPQNLDAEIMLALAIWFLALLLFVFMILLVLAQLIAKSRNDMIKQQKRVIKPRGNYLHTAVRIFQRNKGN